ncbi:PspA/IM30 family protein [Anaerobacillus sp. MEB173]|uniref:PspA/IM30 family protein n=1 Tax=Anaerobacillus sp. MEB173 TaxID=3383345 RepID=UPI003F8E814A
MFKFFGRVKTVMSSELNALLNKAENPVKMLDQMLRDMEKDLAEAEATVARQMANCKMLEKKVDDARNSISKREHQAIQALEAGNEDLARRVIEDKQKLQVNFETLDELYQVAKTDVEDLQQKLKEMKEEYHSMKIKKDSLKVRAETAKMKTKMNRSMSAIGSDHTKQGFERMEEKILQYEAEAETTSDLHVSKSLDEELASLHGNQEVENELEQLKRKLGKE